MTGLSLEALSRGWGDALECAAVNGVAYTMYVRRPHRVAELMDFALRWPSRPHIVQGNRRIAFADLRHGASSKAAELTVCGVGPGDRVLILGWNSPDWVANFWACQLIGAVPVLANAWWSEAELRDAIALAQPAVVLADNRGAARLPTGVVRARWDAAFASPTNPETAAEGALDENDPAAIIFTSGTSGHPKAVVLSHRSLLAGLQQLLQVSRRLPYQVDDTSGAVGLHTGPLFHIGGIQTLLRALTVGDTLVMPEGRFDPANVLELIERYRVSRWSAVPTMVARVLDHPDAKTRDLRSLTSLTIGGAPVHADLLDRVRTGLPGVNARIPTGYGLTENGGQATAASGRDTATRPGTSGRPLPCVELRFAPQPGLPDGEILLRSPTQMSGYLGSDESPIDSDGWLHTGDLGHLDPDGYLWITGRSKDMIIRGGENIAPVAVERALTAIPGVLDAAVIGVPHPELGEEVMAFVVSADASLGPAELAGHLQGAVASFAIPTRWQLQSQPLPTNHTHKVDKQALAALAGALAAQDR